jgi:GH43 family beta-xylosidase
VAMLVPRIGLGLLLAMLLVPLRAQAAGSFGNPIAHSADPWIIQYGGFYYFTATQGCDAGYVCVWKSATITGLGSAPKYDVFQIPGCPSPNCAQVWAPEIHLVGGTFYIYYTADDGSDANHRIFVIQDTSSDPVGAYAEAATGYPHGQLWDSSNLRAIDPDVFQTADGRLYATWSGWPDSTGAEQDIYIAPMSDALHLSGGRVRIAQPTRGWEQVQGPYVEGPVGFQHGGKTFITYSASACSSTSYAVGLLANTDGNLLNPGSWTKSGPVFKYHSGVNGTASFVPTRSPDGTEDWFLVHSNPTGCDGNRVIRAQRLYWDAADGSPLMGYPIADGVQITAPAGELGSTGGGDPFPGGWGNAFGDAAEGDTTDGVRAGNWSVRSASSAGLGSFGGYSWTRLFKASNPNFQTYTVSADLQWVATGSTSAFPKYGIYACYDDRNNWVTAWIDRKYMVLATYAVVQGTAQSWQNAPLPAGFDPTRYHTLTVRKMGATFTFYLDGVQLQQRVFPGTFPVLTNGQVGLITEDTEANYQNVSVYDTQ